jgi:hypothetical protein
MEQLFLSLQKLLEAGWLVGISLFAVVIPWTPLIAWVAFWLLAVNWEKLYPVLAKGAVIGVVLVGLIAVLVWGLIAPPPDGVHHLFGLRPSNFVGKGIYVTMLMTIMALCGSVQLTGACGPLCHFPDDVPDEHHGDDHGHNDHGHSDHSHGDHGHANHGQGDQSHAH